MHKSYKLCLIHLSLGVFTLYACRVSVQLHDLVSLLSFLESDALSYDECVVIKLMGLTSI